MTMPGRNDFRPAGLRRAWMLASLIACAFMAGACRQQVSTGAAPEASATTTPVPPPEMMPTVKPSPVLGEPPRVKNP
jgi:hypothetical protein